MKGLQTFQLNKVISNWAPIAFAGLAGADRGKVTLFGPLAGAGTATMSPKNTPVMSRPAVPRVAYVMGSPFTSVMVMIPLPSMVTSVSLTVPRPATLKV